MNFKILTFRKNITYNRPQPLTGVFTYDCARINMNGAYDLDCAAAARYLASVCYLCARLETKLVRGTVTNRCKSSSWIRLHL